MVETHEYYLEKYGIGWHLLGNNINLCVDINYVEFHKMINHTSFLHRLDGPAIICRPPQEPAEWHINGYEITSKIQQWGDTQNIDLDNLTEMDKVLIKLTWGDYDG